MQIYSIFFSLFVFLTFALAQELCFIDAHSQIDHKAKDLNQVLKRMDENGVKMTLLTTRGKRDWKEIIEWSEKYPKKFIFALDNVWAKHWEKVYGKKVQLWRNALNKIDKEVAKDIVHRNALRLWNLKME